ncbi:SDR family NAD(P)-dependent oxidoreductase [Amycolatopsis nigrescens]|uniref:SDR family NAD(P)-dependent oxidoreductase n=1 Tax=Amycolatopsis nigrescens TaxID=381445 RepID=UPI00037C6CDE|nr:SDR family oxidoreductase [Amycolatopsis nigrescens]
MNQPREVVVTGGGTGIGYATAALFAKQGDRVTITGRRERVLADAAVMLGASYAAFDAADPAAVTAALAELPERVDVLVNNAGGNTDLVAEPPPEGDLAALAASWRANLDANVLTAVLVTEALRPRLADHARIVTIGSIAARSGAGSYGAAKAAIEAWTADLAGALGPRGITANVVSPGLTEDTEFFHGRLSAERRRALAESTLNKRAGTPEDVAETVYFLSGRGARHVTGQVVHVNGGAFLGR